MPASSDSYSVRSGNTPAQSLIGEFVSGNYFATLNVGPHLGRVLSEVDDVATAGQVIVLSYDAWKGQFAGNPAIVGSKVMIQTHPFTVVGIAERGYYGDRVTENAPAFWMPLATEPLIGSAGTSLKDPDTHWLYTIGRRRKGVSADLLQIRLSEVLRQWLMSRPANATQERKAGVARQRVRIVPARTGIQQMTEVYGEGLRNLLLLSSIVLLIACANIANLLQARGIAHRADASIRMALGATQGRLIRQILIESLLLSSLGGIVGLAIGYLGSYLILAFTFPDSVNLPIHATPSLPVLTFAFGVTLICGLLFGTVPARLSSNIQPAEVLRSQNHSSRGISAMPQKILVVFQAALSLVLLVGAILTARTLYNLGHQNFGFAYRAASIQPMQALRTE